MRMPLLLIAALALPSRLVHAGMPSFEVTDLAALRLKGISFFLFGMLICAFAVQRLWNYLQKDFARLPRLSYPKAVGVVTLWGLLFLVVLTMISGARELMTPGAWKKQGATYALSQAETQAQAQAQSQAVLLDTARRQALESLRTMLWKYAQAHDGRFPAHDFVADIPEQAWLVPDGSGLRYVYIGGLSAEQGDRPVAYEPGTFGAERMALLSSGEIKRMALAEIQRAVGDSPVRLQASKD